jgi:hypothetical protein
MLCDLHTKPCNPAEKHWLHPATYVLCRIPCTLLLHKTNHQHTGGFSQCLYNKDQKRLQR